MTEVLHPQPSSADARRSASQGLLVITSTPATTAGRAFLGKSLLAAGAINEPGAYVCEIDTHDWTLVEASFKPSAVTGAFAPSLDRMWFGGVAIRNSAAGANFVAGTLQTLALTDLKGTQRAQVKFTVPGGGSVTFANTDPLVPTSIAEFNGQ